MEAVQQRVRQQLQPEWERAHAAAMSTRSARLAVAEEQARTDCMARIEAMVQGAEAEADAAAEELRR